jgi:hypothetical protein
MKDLDSGLCSAIGPLCDATKPSHFYVLIYHVWNREIRFYWRSPNTGKDLPIKMVASTE